MKLRWLVNRKRNRRLDELRLLLGLFAVSSLGLIKTSYDLNDDAWRDRRVLIALFLIGAVDLIHQAEGLSFGEFRSLAVNVLIDAGWNELSAKSIFDVSASMDRFGPEFVKYGDDALCSGAECFQGMFASGDKATETAAAFTLLGLCTTQWKNFKLPKQKSSPAG